jgi:hydrogenase expression/formation protein HypD
VDVFDPVVERHGLPVVVGGFEPLDVLAGLVLLVEEVRDGTASVTNAYPRCVDDAGNAAAREALWEVFERVPGEWRGVAEVPDASLRLREAYAVYDARRRFDVETPAGDDPTTECICGEIMGGRARPADCPLLGTECTPTDPVGACMVSDEGPCHIQHAYGGRRSP